MKFSVQMTIAFLAAAAMALPVDTEQHPIVGEVRHGSTEVEATAVPVSQPYSLNNAQNSAPESDDDLMVSLKSIFQDQEMPQEGLGTGCFCANGSICCNTANGVDCTQGLCVPPAPSEYRLAPDKWRDSGGPFRTALGTLARSLDVAAGRLCLSISGSHHDRLGEDFNLQGSKEVALHQDKRARTPMMVEFRPRQCQLCREDTSFSGHAPILFSKYVLSQMQPKPAGVDKARRAHRGTRGSRIGGVETAAPFGQQTKSRREPCKISSANGVAAPNHNHNAVGAYVGRSATRWFEILRREFWLALGRGGLRHLPAASEIKSKCWAYGI